MQTMIKNIILFPLLCFLFTEVSGQVTFQKKFAGVGQAVYPTEEGGYVAAGFLYNDTLGKEFWLLKTDAYGDTLFFRNYGGYGAEELMSMAKTSDGGCILAGGTTAFGAGTRDFYVIKTNGDGDTLWTKTYGGPEDDLCFAVIETSDGGYALAGHTYSYGAGNVDMYLVKTDAGGDTLWTRTYGGNYLEQAYSIQETIDGGYIIAGATNSFGAAVNDIYIVRTDDKGDLLWSKLYGGNNAEPVAHILALDDGSFMIGGNQNSFGAGAHDFFLLKISSNGSILWQKSYGGFSSEFLYHIQKNNDESFLMLGYSSSFSTASSAGYALCVDSLGAVLWSRVYDHGNGDQLNHGYQAADKGFILTGYYGGKGAVLIKTDSLGRSGCKEKAVLTTVSNMDFTAKDVATIVSSGGIVGSTATLMINGGLMETYCVHIPDTTLVINHIPDNKGIKVYPNPATHGISLQYEGTLPAGSMLSVYTAAGQEVESFVISASAGMFIELQPEKYRPGVYLLWVHSGGILIAREKLVVMPGR
jgi:hypothetical protein